MRELLLSATVATICLVALVRPRVGLYGYVWFALVRPEILAYSAMGWYSSALAVTTFLGCLRIAGGIRWVSLWNPICGCLFLLQVPILLSVLTAVDPSLCAVPYNAYVRMVVVGMIIPLLIQTEQQLRTLVVVITLSMGFLGLRFGAFGILHGGARFTQGYGGMLSGNNELGIAFAMITPFCYYAGRLTSAWWLKIIFWGMTVATIAALVWTYSRGAAVALVAVLLLITLRSKHRIVALVSIVLVTAPIVYLVKDTYVGRMATITAPGEESSARSRFEFAQVAIAMWQDYPLFGVGFGQQNYSALSSSYLGYDSHLVVHNSYLQTLVDSGIFAFLIYTGLLFGTIIWLGISVRRARRNSPGLALYPMIFQTSLVAFAVSSTFGSREGFDFYYIVLMCAASWYTLQKNGQVSSLPDQQHTTELADEPAYIALPI
jgi:putative inorganic carbon (HCO3(-)) transporter